jgi:hypothetical protein
MNPEHSKCTGRAAHIYSASAGKRAPRGSGGLSDEELKSLANAMWLCADHADLVDKNRGVDYPPGLLLSYKALHEARIARELGGIHTPLGWVDAIHIKSSPLFANHPAIDLGKLTLFIGQNGVGKTALCDWLASAANPAYLERWNDRRLNGNGVSVEVRYLDPDPHIAKVSLLAKDYPQYELDDATTYVPAAPVKVIIPGKLRFPAVEEKPDDLALISSVLGLHRFEVLALCDAIASNGTDYVTRAWFQEDEEGYFLHADVKGTHPGLTFRALSSRECDLVLMELAIAAASQFSRTRPTLLILDAGLWSLDTVWLKRYGEILSSANFGFQTVASIPTSDLNFDELRWAGWKVIRLEGKPPNVTLNFDVRTETA